MYLFVFIYVAIRRGPRTLDPRAKWHAHESFGQSGIQGPSGRGRRPIGGISTGPLTGTYTFTAYPKLKRNLRS